MTQAPPSQPLLRTLQDLLAGLANGGAEHMIIGGLAAIARGVVRHTDDADVWLTTAWGHSSITVTQR